jgi:hypothetical protein
MHVQHALKMTKYRISYIIDGLHDVIPNKEDTLNVADVIFHYRESERVGTISLEDIDSAQAQVTALREITKSLYKVCFAYNTEAMIKRDAGVYIVDITNKPDIEKVIGTFILRWSYVKWEREDTISKIQSISKNKMDLLDLALAYYRLGYYDNPLRIEAFFSCLTVIIRNILGIPEKYDVKTSSLKYGIKEILMVRDSNFDNDKFEKAWKDCYGDERCSIVHGRGSRLIDISKIPEHEKLVNMVHFWTREVIYDFIERNQSV